MKCPRALVVAAVSLSALAVASRAAEARKCPNVLIVLDRSGSMLDPPSGGIGQSKWALSVSAITAALQKYGDRLSFGLEMFTSNGVGNSCYTDTKIDVPVAHGSSGQIISILGMNGPSGGTNTGEAIKRGYTDGGLTDATRGNYMLLITDGDPNCNASEPAYTVAEITNATKQTPTIHTFVVGFDGTGGVNPGNLNNMANAGLEPVPGCTGMANSPCYYSASTTQKFLDAMDKIIGSLAGGSVIGGCDDTCFSNGCPSGQVCGIPTGATDPSCFVDPCAAMTCPNDQYCKDGQCQAPCPICTSTQKCVAGQCVVDSCAQKQCGAGTACDPKTGMCVTNLCTGAALNCPLPLYCDPVSGKCVDDPCRFINCPVGTTCYGGYCSTDPPPAIADMSVSPPDIGATDEPDLASSTTASPDLGTVHVPQRTGCALGGQHEGLGIGALIFGLVGLALVVRRRRWRR